MGRTVPDRTRPGSASQSRVGQRQAGLGGAGQGSARQDRAEQSQTGSRVAGQGRAASGRADEGQTGSDTIRQDHGCQAWQGRAGYDLVGTVRSGHTCNCLRG